MDTPDSNVSPPNSAIPPPQSQTTTPNEPAEDTTEKTLDETSTAEEDPIRKRLKDETLRRTNKEITPRGWQLDVAMALIEGKDAVVVAGTGEGKTLAFTLPLFNRTQYQKNRIMLVISPLNMLEADQRESFKKLGLKAVVINHETYHDGMEEIQAGGCDIILTSPEMCLTSERFRTFLSDPKFGAQIMMIVVDEAHCIVNLIPNPVPVLATSATLTPDDITIVRDVMEVAIMPSTTTDYSALYELLVDRSTGEERLRRTIIFLDDREEAMAACRQIREDCPPHLKELCDFLHAMRGEGTKIRVFRDFKTGKIYVLVATEAAGMGCDIRDIELVIQWGVCSDLATWLQRAGRAGRDPTIKARAIMFVPASTFHERAPAEGGKESTKDQRKAKELVLNYIRCEICRRDFVQPIFDNPGVRKVPTGDCCDVCKRRRDIMPRKDVPQPPPTNQDAKKASRVVSAGPKPLADTSAARQTRTQEWLSDALKSLRKWRTDTWYAKYRRQRWTSEGLLPDKVLTSMADRMEYVRGSALGEGGLEWIFADIHGQDVIDVLKAVDRRFDEGREGRRLARNAKERENHAARLEKRKNEESGVVDASSGPSTVKKPRSSSSKLRGAEETPRKPLATVTQSMGASPLTPQSGTPGVKSQATWPTPTRTPTRAQGSTVPPSIDLRALMKIHTWGKKENKDR